MRGAGTALVILTLLALTTRAIAQSGACTSEALPGQVRSLLKRKYPGWKIVQSSDLRAEDQQLWRRSHDGECPGLVIGKFESDVEDSYAITLFRKSAQLEQLLVVVTPRHLAAKVHLLSVPSPVAYLSVISKWPPGTYPDVDKHQVRIRREAISFEAIEAGATLYYYRDGSYHSAATSE